MSHRKRLAGIAPHVRRMRLKGWSVESIASAYRIATADVRAILVPRPPRPPRPVKQPRWVDSWRAAAKSDERYRDDVGLDQVELPTAAGPVTRDTVTQIPAAKLEPPAPSAWSGPASPFQTSLHGGRRRLKD